MARDIRRPSGKSSSGGVVIFLILILVIGGASYLYISAETFFDNSDEDLSNALKSENQMLRIEIDSLKKREKDLESNLDSSKNKIEDLKIDVRLLERDIEDQNQKIEDLYSSDQKTKKTVDKPAQTNTQGARVKIKANSQQQGYREVDLSRKQKLTLGPKLKYPRRALQRELTGKVNIIYDISEIGTPFNIRVLSSSASVFDKSAIEAVEKMLYIPAADNKGRNIIAQGVKLTLTFEIN
jgi:TonB family protein